MCVLTGRRGQGSGSEGLLFDHVGIQPLAFVHMRAARTRAATRASKGTTRQGMRTEDSAVLPAATRASKGGQAAQCLPASPLPGQPLHATRPLPGAPDSRRSRTSSKTCTVTETSLGVPRPRLLRPRHASPRQRATEPPEASRLKRQACQACACASTSPSHDESSCARGARRPGAQERVTRQERITTLSALSASLTRLSP